MWRISNLTQLKADLDLAKAQAITDSYRVIDEAGLMSSTLEKPMRNHVIKSIVNEIVQRIEEHYKSAQNQETVNAFIASFKAVSDHKQRLKIFGLFIALVTLVLLPIVCAGKLSFNIYAFTQVGLSGIAVLASIYIMYQLHANIAKLKKKNELSDEEIEKKVMADEQFAQYAKREIIATSLPLLKALAYRYVHASSLTTAAGIGEATLKCSMVGYLIMGVVTILLTLASANGNISLSTYAGLALTKASITLIVFACKYMAERKIINIGCC